MPMTFFEAIDAVESNFGIVRRKKIDGEDYEYWIDFVSGDLNSPADMSVEVVVQGPDGSRNVIEVKMAEVVTHRLYGVYARAIEAMMEMKG